MAAVAGGALHRGRRPGVDGLDGQSAVAVGANGVFYLVAPLLDWVLGVDQSNPPESALPALENDRYYRRITFLLVPVLRAAFIFSAWWGR